MSNSIPIKIDNGKSYVCSVCGHKRPISYEIQTYAGNTKRRCWGCLTDKHRAAYLEAHPTPPVPTSCKVCGAGIKMIGQGKGIACCAGCDRPTSLCKCTKSNGEYL